MNGLKSNIFVRFVHVQKCRFFKNWNFIKNHLSQISKCAVSENIVHGVEAACCLAKVKALHLWRGGNGRIQERMWQMWVVCAGLWACVLCVKCDSSNFWSRRSDESQVILLSSHGNTALSEHVTPKRMKTSVFMFHIEETERSHEQTRAKAAKMRRRF